MRKNPEKVEQLVNEISDVLNWAEEDCELKLAHWMKRRQAKQNLQHATRNRSSYQGLMAGSSFGMNTSR